MKDYDAGKSMIINYVRYKLYLYCCYGYRMEKANRERLIDKKMKSLTKNNRQAPTVFWAYEHTLYHIFYNIFIYYLIKCNYLFISNL